MTEFELRFEQTNLSQLMSVDVRFGTLRLISGLSSESIKISVVSLNIFEELKIFDFVVFSRNFLKEIVKRVYKLLFSSLLVNSREKRDFGDISTRA